MGSMAAAERNAYSLRMWAPSVGSVSPRNRTSGTHSPIVKVPARPTGDDGAQTGDLSMDFICVPTLILTSRYSTQPPSLLWLMDSVEARVPATLAEVAVSSGEDDHDSFTDARAVGRRDHRRGLAPELNYRDRRNPNA